MLGAAMYGVDARGVERGRPVMGGSVLLRTGVEPPTTGTMEQFQLWGIG